MSGEDPEVEWREEAESWTRLDDSTETVREFQAAFEDAVEAFEDGLDGSLVEALGFVSPCLSACDLLAIYGLESGFGTDPDACPPDGRFGESPWCGFQFDRATATELGLTVDEEAGIDERAERPAAAGAAMRHLLGLGRLLARRRFDPIGVEGELPEAGIRACARTDCETLRKLVYASHHAGPAAVARARVRAGDDCCDWDAVKRHLPKAARTYAERGRVYRSVFCPPPGDDGGGGAADDTARTEGGTGDAPGRTRGGDGTTGSGDGAADADHCFIATAAYGTPTAAEIDVLRAFRDEVLRRNALGRLAVRAYYRTSPPVAAWLVRSDRRRRLARRFLVEPVVRTVRTLWHRN